MSNKQITIILWLIFALLSFLCFVIIIKIIYNPPNELFSILSGSSTFVIALLTIIYVATTRNQMNIMSRQLDEMKKDRELQNQPLPWPIKVYANSEKPRFFYSPPERNVEVTSRHSIGFHLKNIGLTPAISVDICCFLILNNGKESIRLGSASVRIDALEVNQEFSFENHGEFFLFPSDRKGVLLKQVLEKSVKKLPLIELNIFFRNILGACFHIKSFYILYLKDDYRETIKDWLERLNNFPIRNKEMIDVFYQYMKSSDARTEEIFEELKMKCDEGLENIDIKYHVWPIPASTKVSCINLHEYMNATKDLSYGILTGSDWMCNVIDENNIK